DHSDRSEASESEKTRIGFSGDFALTFTTDQAFAAWNPADFNDSAVAGTSPEFTLTQVSAVNNTDVISLAGGLAITSSSGTERGTTAALGGSFAVNIINMDTAARLGSNSSDSELSSPGTVSVNASVGQGGTSAKKHRGKGEASDSSGSLWEPIKQDAIFLAGSASLGFSSSKSASSVAGGLSLSLNYTDLQTDALIVNVSLQGPAGATAGAVSVEAIDAVRTDAVGGVIEASLTSGGGKGVGIGGMSALNYVKSTTTALIQNSSVDAQSIAVKATSQPKLYAMAIAGSIVVGDPVVAISGAFALNRLRRDVTATITGTDGDDHIKAAGGDITLSVSDNPVLHAISAGAALAFNAERTQTFTAVIGAAVSHNELDVFTAGNGAVAEISDVTISAPNGDLHVHALSQPTLTAMAVPVGVLGEKATAGVNIAGAIALNRLHGEVRSLVDVETLECRDLKILADYKPQVSARTFEVAFSVLWTSGATFSLVIGLTWTMNSDAVSTSATLGTRDSRQAGKRNVSASGNVQVKAFRSPSSDSSPMYVSHSVGNTVNLVVGNDAAIGVEGLGMFAYNSIEGAVSATIGAVQLTGASSVTVEAADQSSIESKSIAVSIGAAATSGAFALSLGAITQVSVNFETAAVTASVEDSDLTVATSTIVQATKNPKLESVSTAVQVALALSSTVSIAAGGIYTNVANNPDRRASDSEEQNGSGGPPVGASAQVLNSTIRSGNISVAATATPQYKTTIVDVATNLGLAGTAAFAVSAGWVRARNRLYDKVDASVLNSKLTSTTGAIEVLATMDRPSLSQANMESDLQSVLVSTALASVGTAIVVGGTNASSISQAEIFAVIRDSDVDAATTVTVKALDKTSIDTSWNSVDVAVAFGLDVIISLPKLNAEINNSVHADVGLKDHDKASIVAKGLIAVAAQSRAAVAQNVKQVAVGLGFGVTFGNAVVDGTLSGDIHASVAGTAQPDSLILRSESNDITVHAAYAGDLASGPQLTTDVTDWSAELSGADIDAARLTWTVSPIVAAQVTGGVQLQAEYGTIEISSATKGKIEAEVEQTIAVGVGLGLAVSNVKVSSAPVLKVAIGDGNDTAPSLQAANVTLSTESQLDATGKVKQWGYGAVAAAVVDSNTTVIENPSITLKIEQNAAIAASQQITITATAGTNRNPHPTDVKNVDASSDEVDFGGRIHGLNDGDLLKYSGTDTNIIQGLSDGTLYHVLTVDDTRIQLGEQFQAPLVQIDSDRLVFSEATAFEPSKKTSDGIEVFAIESWNPSQWSTVIYNVPAGTAVAGLTPGKKYLVNKIDDSTVMLFEYTTDAQGNEIRPNPPQPKQIQSNYLTNDSGKTIFNVSSHGFTDGQLVSYVAPTSIRLGAGSVNTTAVPTLGDSTSGSDAVKVTQGGEGSNDNAIYVGDQITELIDNQKVIYKAGDSKGNWYWNDVPKGNEIGAQGEFWNTADGSAPDGAYSNWGTSEPASVNADSGHLAMKSDGTWSSKSSSDTLGWYVMERPIYVALSYDGDSFDRKDIADWVRSQSNDTDTYWLPTVGSTSEVDILAQVMKNQNVTYAWLGGTDQGQPDAWMWDTLDADADNGTQFWLGRADGEAVDFQPPWAGQEPNDDNSKAGKNKESFLIAHWDSAASAMTWNDAKSKFKEAAPDNTAHPTYVIVERSRYLLVQSDAAGTHADAEQKAGNNGGWLATIGSDDDNALVQDLLQQSSADEAWLGGATVNGIKGLIDGHSYRVKKFAASPGATVGLSNWGVGEPNDYKGNEDYAIMRADGTWNDVSNASTEKYGYVLWKNTTSGPSWVYQAGPFTWDQAVSDAKSRGGYVASVVTYDDQVQIRNAAGGNVVWINNTDKDNEGEWLAYDYTTAKYDHFSNWSSSEPNNFGGESNNGGEDYAVMTSSGKWNDVPGNFTTNGYVLYLPNQKTYTLITNTWGIPAYIKQQFTFPQAVYDAQRRGGSVASVTTLAEQNLVKNAAGGYTVWLNITDSYKEGTWQVVLKDGNLQHYQSIQLLEDNGSVVTTTPPVSSFTFELIPEGNDAIRGLTDGQTYRVRTLDSGSFYLVNGNDEAIEAVLPNPGATNFAGFIGTMGLDLTKAGTGLHRLVFDLTASASFSSQFPQLEYHASRSTNKESGTGNATVIATAHTGALYGISLVHSNLSSTPAVSIFQAAGSSLRVPGNTGSIKILGSAFGNAVSSLYAKSGGVVAISEASATVQVDPRVEVDIQGLVQAATVEAKSETNGTVKVLTQATAKGVLGFSRADSAVTSEPRSWLHIGVKDSGPPDRIAIILGDTDIDLKATLGMYADVQTVAVTGAAFGSCRTNWKSDDDDSDDATANAIPAIQMKGLDNSDACEVTVGNARIEVADSDGKVTFEALVGAVHGRVRSRALANGLLANKATATVTADLDAAVNFLNKAVITSSTVNVKVLEEDIHLISDALIRKNLGKALATTLSTADVQARVESGARFLTTALNVDARQHQYIPPGKTEWINNPSDEMTATAAVQKKKDSDKAQATITVNVNTSRPWISWDGATYIGWADASLNVPANGSIATSSPISTTITSGVISITGVKNYTASTSMNLNYSTIDHNRFNGAAITAGQNYSLPSSVVMTPRVSINNFSPNDIKLTNFSTNSSSSLPTSFNLNGTPQNISASLQDEKLSLHVTNSFAGKKLLLDGDVTANEMHLSADGDISTSSNSVTLTANHFDLVSNNGSIGGSISGTQATTPQVTLQSFNQPGAAVFASAKIDLPLNLKLQPQPNGDVGSLITVAAQQMDLRLLPWTATGGAADTNYHIDASIRPSSISRRIVSFSGNTTPDTAWNGRPTPGIDPVGIDLTASISNEPTRPRLMISGTAGIQLNVSSGSPLSHVERVESTSSDVQLNADSDLTIDTLVAAPGTVAWLGQHSLLGSGGTSPTVQASTLRIAGGGGLGGSHASPLTTSVISLLGSGPYGSGPIFVSNTDRNSGLLLSDLSVSKGDLYVSNSAQIIVTGPVSNTGGGAISLVANGTGSEYRLQDVVLPDVSFWNQSRTLPDRYANWAASEPNNSGGAENYATMNADGRWNDVSGTSRFNYVLFVPETQTYTLITDQKRTFSDALIDAQQRGGYVARIATAAEQNTIQTLANGTVIWLNMSDDGHEGDWRYSQFPAAFTWSGFVNNQPTGIPVGYSNWAVGEPNNYG
ncbi:MAG: hypothetical protein RLZZ436_4619, partial [Planctomycetota bacterium]